MPISTADKKALKDALGESHQELLDRVLKSSDDDELALDRHSGDLKKAQAEAKKANAALTKAQGDLEARGKDESETIAKLQAKLDKSTAETKSAQDALVTHKKTTALFNAVLEKVPDANRARDIADMYAMRNGLDGLSLADGKLEGYKSGLDAMEKASPYLFKTEAQGGGHGGPGPGADPGNGGAGGAGGGDGNLTPAQKAAQMGAKAADVFLSRRHDPLNNLFGNRGQGQGGQGGQGDNQQQQQQPTTGTIREFGENAASL